MTRAPEQRQRFASAATGQVGGSDWLSLTELVRQRSMLIILIAACTSARTAFEAADNLIDAELRADLSRMIERSEAELANLTRTIADAG